MPNHRRKTRFRPVLTGIVGVVGAAGIVVATIVTTTPAAPAAVPVVVAVPPTTTITAPTPVVNTLVTANDFSGGTELTPTEVVGALDITPGLYLTKGGPKCAYTRNPDAGWMVTGFPTQQVVVSLRAGDLFNSKGCEPWTLVRAY